MAIIIYIILCLLVGYFGRNRQIGFVLSFVLAFFITPIIMALILLITGERRTKPAKG